MIERFLGRNCAINSKTVNKTMILKTMILKYKFLCYFQNVFFMLVCAFFTVPEILCTVPEILILILCTVPEILRTSSKF